MISWRTGRSLLVGSCASTIFDVIFCPPIIAVGPPSMLISNEMPSALRATSAQRALPFIFSPLGGVMFTAYSAHEPTGTFWMSTATGVTGGPPPCAHSAPGIPTRPTTSAAVSATRLLLPFCVVIGGIRP